jgi:hypothetical protein
VEAAELLADQLIHPSTLIVAGEQAADAYEAIQPSATLQRRAANMAYLATQDFSVDPHPHDDACKWILGSLRDFDYDDSQSKDLSNAAWIVALLRDIFGNPFRPVTFDSRWRTSDVVGLARAIYDDKAFERMPILADALMDAGCEDEQIITHCRGDGPHVRGCWVVDLVLGKE